MRTTVRLDDEILDRLKARARHEQVSVTRMLNRALKAGLRAGVPPKRAQAAYRERAQAMGGPRLALDQALALAATLEDEEIVREVQVRR